MLKSNPKVKKTFQIISNVLSYLFLTVCIILVVLIIGSKKNQDGAMNFFGRQIRIVVSDSMAECEQTDVSEYEIKSIPVKSMVFIENIPKNQTEKNEWYSSLKVGDVVMFNYVYVSQITLTHRIINITEKDGGYLIYLKGDNQSANSLEQIIDTTQIDSENHILGKVTGQSYGLGAMVIALKNPVIIISIIIIPCLIITGFEIMRLITAIKTKKEE